MLAADQGGSERRSISCEAGIRLSAAVQRRRECFSLLKALKMMSTCSSNSSRLAG